MRGISGALGGIVSGLGKIGLAGLGVSAIGNALSGLTDGLMADAIGAEQIAKATEAVIASTKGVAGISAAAVADLAGELSRLTPFEDEAIAGAQNLLLTFTGIGKDVFPTATETVLNMSQALGQDLKSSALQLGKALNDPIAGVTALRRVGVQLTDAQQDLIKSLMASGDLLGAQKVILGELETEFGGAARAAGETFAGKLTILQTQIGNVKEAIGGALIPVFSDLMTSMTPAISLFAERLPGAIAALRFEFDGVVTALRTDAGALGPILAGWGAAFVAWIGPMIAPMLAELGRLATQALAWIKAQIPPLLAQLQLWGNQFSAWIGPMILPMLSEAGKIVTNFLDWITLQGPPLAQRFLSDWVPAAIGWVARVAVDIVPKLLGLILVVGAWILTEAVPRLIKFAFAMGTAIVTGILQGIGNLAGKLGEFIGGELAKIQIDVGPFHLSGREGFRIDAPQMPSISLPSIPGFASGGMVPGPMGAPMLAVVHGGERVLPVGRGGNGGGPTINIYGPVYASDMETVIADAYWRLKRRGEID